jgi:hypothetical protein
MVETASTQLTSESDDQVDKVFEWLDSSDEEKQDSRLLKEFRAKNKVQDI